MKIYIKSSTDTKSDFTVIQNIYSDGMEYMENTDTPPVYTQEYPVNLDEVLSAYPDAEKYALKGWIDETFKAGDLITETTFGSYVKYVISENQMFGDYKKYVKSHPGLPDPCRSVEVRINNPKCLPSAAAESQKRSEEMGRYLGRKLGLKR